jgi:hypothetical protein
MFVAFLSALVVAPRLIAQDCGCTNDQATVQDVSSPVCACDIMDTRNFRLIDYRRMFKCGTTPTTEDLVGQWKGVNKGVVELVGYKQFIKEIKPGNCVISGDNIMVGQVSEDLLRCVGWQPKLDPCTGEAERRGKFAICPPHGRGAFKHGVEFNYRYGGNRKRDPVRLLVDRVVKIDDNHLLGRATANFGPFHIPLAYFMLERM